MIHQIEGLGTKLERQPLAESVFAEEREVDVLEPIGAQNVPSGAAKCELARGRERALLEPDLRARVALLTAPMLAMSRFIVYTVPWN